MRTVTIMNDAQLPAIPISGEEGMVMPSDLPVSSALVDKYLAWCREYSENDIDSDDAFFARGHDIATAMQQELGSTFHVRYVPLGQRKITRRYLIK